ncbi:MAG: DNA polymerase III subunit delta [Pseudomonadota bacterium]
MIGLLLFGSDSGLIAAKQREVIAAVMDGEMDDLRLTDLNAADARKDAALIDEALRARGFFPGRRVVTILGGTDGLAKPLNQVLEGVTADDALLIVTADALPARSGLRKLFESRADLASLQFFDDGLTPEDLRSALASAGLTTGVTQNALDVLTEITRDMDHGSSLQLIETLATYGMGSTAPLDVAAVRSIAPMGSDTDIDRFVEAVAGGRPEQIGPLLRRLMTSGIQPVALVLALQRHFRLLMRVISDQNGIDSALGSVRPPLWGARRHALAAQARRWPLAQVEAAARMLFETDGRLRSSGQVPDRELVERCGLRLAMMAGR